MADEEDDDLYDEEFDFVDEDDEEESDEEEASADDSEMTDDGADDRPDEAERDEPEAGADGAEPEAVEDEYGRTEPVANYVVHVYEDKKFKRTIDRPFTPEDAEAFATEFNRTAKNYSRMAVTSKNDAKPKKALE